MATKKKFRYFHTDEHFSKPEPLKSCLKNASQTDKKSKKRKVRTPEEKNKLSVAKRENVKKRKQKKRRLIIRNLSFKVEEEELKKIFSKFGTVVDVSLPKKSDGKKRGFAFVQFDNLRSSIQAIKILNFKELHGRPIAVDYALSKDKYEHNMNSSKASDDIEMDNKEKSRDDDTDEKDSSENELKLQPVSDEEEEDDDMQPEERLGDFSGKEVDAKVENVLKELDFDVKSDDEEEEEESSDSDDESVEDKKQEKEVDDEDEDNESDEDDTGSQVSEKFPRTTESRKPYVKNSSSDTEEGKTIFVKNISFDTTKEVFREAMEKFGSIEYCLLCMDPLTELPKGTAFVKFQTKESAQNLLHRACEEGGYLVNDRRLYCDFAISREEVNKRMEGKVKVKKDKRNLALLKEGVIMVNSPEAEGVSQTDMKRRSNLEMLKKQKLKNLNFFVSDVRLCIHNVPKNYTDQELRKLFKRSAGPNAVVTEARVMKELCKVDSDGKPKSKGFGFVEFTRHDDALKALQALNNNPSVFSSQSRPIVEFSVENHLALLTKQRRKERNKLKIEKGQRNSEDWRKNQEYPKSPGSSHVGKSRNGKKEFSKWNYKKNRQQQNSPSNMKPNQRSNMKLNQQSNEKPNVKTNQQSNAKSSVKTNQHFNMKLNQKSNVKSNQQSNRKSNLQSKTRNKKARNRNKLEPNNKGNFEKEFGSFRNLTNMYKKKLFKKMT